jgi:hypothetical protein
VISASHTAELADHFGRIVRNIVARHQGFLGFTLSADSKAAGRWETSQGGEYLAAGIGGAISGRRADLAIIDDPVKSREDADWFRQEWNRQTGDPAPTNFEGVKELVGDEIIKAVTGGAGALGDREGIKKTLDAANSPEALNSILDQYRDLSVGQLKTFRRRYEFGTGRKDFDEMLAPETRELFGDGGGSQGQGGGSAGPAGQGGAAPAPGGPPAGWSVETVGK